jgi:hypothetical protein
MRTRKRTRRSPFRVWWEPSASAGELDFSPAESRFICKERALQAAEKLWPETRQRYRRIEVAPCFRSAEALHPPHKCEGSHRAPGPSAGWEPSALAEGSNASALRERVRKMIVRFSAGNSRGLKS